MLIDEIVHVIDDDDAVRKSLAFLLSSEELSVLTYETAEAFLDAAPEKATGCVVSDIRMPGIDGIEFLRRLRMRGVSLPVIVMTGHADVAMAVEAMKQGATDFVEKPFDDDVFLQIVKLALRHASSRQAHADLVAQTRSRLDRLSDREHQILDGLVEGKANKVMARDLGISHRTIEIYRANVMQKMQADSLSSLLRMVLATRDRALDMS